MRALVRRLLGPAWQVLRRRHPGVAARVEDAALTVSTRGNPTGEVRALQQRVAELERDHLLLAAHVATLTERLGAGERPGAPDEEAARQRARTAAVAFYEERIGRLEQRAARRGGPRDARTRSSGRTAGERSGAER